MHKENNTASIERCPPRVKISNIKLLSMELIVRQRRHVAKMFQSTVARLGLLKWWDCLIGN